MRQQAGGVGASKGAIARQISASSFGSGLSREVCVEATRDFVCDQSSKVVNVAGFRDEVVESAALDLAHQGFVSAGR